jgi:cytochrome c oxidase subunit IV
MADRTTGRGPVSAAAVGFGAAYLLAGTALLLQELGLLALRWSLVSPLLLLAVGLVVVVMGFTGAHGSRRNR